MLYLCYSINDFYAREAGISMLSFLDNNPDYEPQEVFFVDYGIHPANRERLDGIAARYGKRVTYLDGRPVTDEMKRRFSNLKAWHGSMAANAKPFLDKIVPNYVERLLFMDADTLTVQPVTELMHLDMGGAALAACTSYGECHRLRKKEYRLYSGNQIYIYTGMMLYDLRVWRRENCHGMMVDTLRKKKRLPLPDQTLINNAIPERLIKVLPIRFNYLTHTFHPWQEYHWMRQHRIYSKQECREAINRPVIIHYVGGWSMARPWHEDCHSHRKAEYYHYKALSPWKDTPLYPSILKTQPPQGWYNKLFVHVVMLMDKPLPYFLVHPLVASVNGLGRLMVRMRGGSTASSEGIEEIDNI